MRKLVNKVSGQESIKSRCVHLCRSWKVWLNVSNFLMLVSNVMHHEFFESKCTLSLISNKIIENIIHSRID